MQHVMIAQFGARMRFPLHHRRVQSAMPPLILDVFPPGCPSNIPSVIVRGDAIPMRHFMFGRWFGSTERLGYEYVDTSFPFVRNRMQMHVVIACASDPRPQNVRRIFSAHTTMGGHFVVRFEADHITPLFCHLIYAPS